MTSSASDGPASSVAAQQLLLPGRETPVTEYNVPMVSPGSIDSVASTETIRPTTTAPGTAIFPSLSIVVVERVV
jgi:hypothetical protein